MKQSPNDYAEMLINQHSAIGLQLRNEGIQCAINDVNNTIEALTELQFNYNYPTITHYTEVLNILKSKL